MLLHLCLMKKYMRSEATSKFPVCVNYCFCTHTELAWSVISLPEPPQFTTFDHDVWVPWDVQQLHLWPHKIGDRHIRQTVGSNLKHLWKNNKHLSELELCNTNTTSHTYGLFSRVAWHSHCWPSSIQLKLLSSCWHLLCWTDLGSV